MRMREPREIVNASLPEGDSEPELISRVGDLVISIRELLLLLRSVGMEEKGKNVIKEEVRIILYED